VILPPGQSARRWQLAAEEAVRSAYQAGMRSVLVAAATGTGKGTFLAGLAAQAAAKGSRVLVLVHRRTLIEDLAERTRRCGVGVGVCLGGRHEVEAQVVIASVQALRGRLADLAAFQLVITDECHHASAPTYQAIYERLTELGRWRHLGLTATPYRMGRGGQVVGLLGGEGPGAFQATAYEYGIGAAIAAGDLVPVRAVRVRTEVDLASVRLAGSDYDANELARAVDTPGRNALAAERFKALAAGRPGLAFAASVEHAQRLAEALRAVGVRAEPVWGELPKREQDRLIGEYAAGRIDVLVSRDLLYEGFDAPRAQVLLKARPTRSQIVYTQLVGRGLRQHPGKSECLLIDLIDGGADLSLDVEIESEERPARTWLREGSRVVMALPPDLGVGRALGQVEGQEGLWRVRWPGAGGGVLTVVGASDLARAPREQAEAEDLREAAGPVAGVRWLGDEQVRLIEEAGDLLAGRWTPYAGGWTAWAVDDQRRRWVVRVRRLKAGWRCWSWGPNGPPVAEKAGPWGELSLALGWGSQWLAQRGQIADQVEGDGRPVPREALARWRLPLIPRDLGHMARLQVAAQMAFAVAEWSKELARRHAGGGRR
jgi:superfamily II DNA or RNA helicase